ncbi:MAG: hypothetical protein ACK5KL_10280 [Dysgonomonas sp.]
MDKEVKILFETMYLPIALGKGFYNGNDFIKSAFQIMDKVREKTTDEEKIKRAAFTLVKCFNDLLNPKMTIAECNDIMAMLVRNSPTSRSFIR